MYRLLIVDDELFVIEMLVDLFESKFTDVELELFTADNGGAALEFLKTCKIDVILLDINMPGVDGFEVARQVERNWPECRIIILTGSDDFDNIYEATRQKNTSYLLKTESDDVILDSVKDAISTLETNRKNRSLIRLSLQKEAWIHYLITREVFKSFMNGRDFHKSIASEGIRKSDFRIDVDRDIFFLYTNVRFETADLSWHRNKIHLLRIQSCLEKVLQDRFIIEIYLKDTSTLLFFIQPKDESFEGAVVAPYVFLSESVDTFGIVLYDECRIISLLMLYDTCTPIGTIPALSRKMEGYFTRHYLKGAPATSLAVVVSDDILAGPPEDTVYILSSKTQEKINSIEFLLYQHNLSDLIRLLDDIFLTMFTHKSIHHLQSIELYQMISLQYLHYINHLGLNDTLMSNIGLSSLFFLGNFQHWDQVFEYLKRLSKIVIKTVTSVAGDRNELIIMSIKRYIRKNLHKTLTLSTIANHVNYNSSYISRTFKKHANTSITEYIRQTKINKAKSDLTSTNKSINEIAADLGFATSRYFSITFRKATGISPSEYRFRNVLTGYLYDANSETTTEYQE